MRTTLTLERDVAEGLKRETRRTGARLLVDQVAKLQAVVGANPILPVTN